MVDDDAHEIDLLANILGDCDEDDNMYVDAMLTSASQTPLSLDDGINWVVDEPLKRGSTRGRVQPAASSPSSS